MNRDEYERLSPREKWEVATAHLRATRQQVVGDLDQITDPYYRTQAREFIDYCDKQLWLSLPREALPVQRRYR